MNELSSASSLRPETLDARRYLQSLTEQAMRLGLMTSRQFEALEGNLLSLLAAQTDKLNGGKSSSIRLEQAQELLGGVRVTAESLPASVPQYLDSGWLTVENRTVWRVELLDKQGRVLAKDGDSATTLAGRAVQVRFPSTGNYMQMMGLYRDGQITRLVNSYKDASGQVRAGTLNYPEYTGVTNQRDKAVLSDTNLRFVYLRFSQADRIRQLQPSVAEFSAGLGQWERGTVG